MHQEYGSIMGGHIRSNSIYLLKVIKLINYLLPYTKLKAIILLLPPISKDETGEHLNGEMGLSELHSELVGPSNHMELCNLHLT